MIGKYTQVKPWPAGHDNAVTGVGNACGTLDAVSWKKQAKASDRAYSTNQRLKDLVSLKTDS